MTPKHSVLITFKPKSENHEAFAAVMRSVKSDLPSVPGCLGVHVYSHSDNSGHFTLLEDWATKDAHAAHLDKVVKSGAWDTIVEMLVEEPTSTVLSKV